MEYGICLMSVVGVRERPDHRYEMVTQLLFGELFEVLETRNSWHHIRVLHDSYQGWIHASQAEIIGFEEFTALKSALPLYTLDLISFVGDLSGKSSFPVSAGSTIYLNGSHPIRIAGRDFSFPENVVEPGPDRFQDIPDLALLFLNTPYLWGGRSVFGIDCSGFVQLVYMMAGIRIPRDAAVQSTQGDTIHLINEARPGDLLFFDNPEGEIVHTGICLHEGL